MGSAVEYICIRACLMLCDNCFPFECETVRVGRYTVHLIMINENKLFSDCIHLLDIAQNLNTIFL